MIRALRRRHRWMIALLAVAVAVLFVAALAVRPERPVQPSLDGEPAEASPAPGSGP